MNQTDQTEPRDEQFRDELIQSLLGHDDEWNRGRAAEILSHDNPEVFPIRDDENQRWVLRAEADRLDGTIFLGRWAEIREEGRECPECGNTREEFGWWDNGIVQGHQAKCTVCGFIHEEDAG